MFAVLRTAHLDREGGALDFGETHLFVGPAYVVSLRHGPSPPYVEVRARCEASPPLLARGPGFVIVQRDARGDSIGYKRICREIGRMQILPCHPDSKGKIQPIDWTWLTPHCNKKNNLYVYDHNIRCGAAILAYNYRKYGSWMEVVKRYNGSGDQAEEYRAHVEQILGRIILRMVEKAQSDSSAEVSLAGFGIGR